MPISLSEHYHISEDFIEATGVFDVILDMDAHVFIDPALIPLCQEPEFIGAKEKVEKFFSDIITLMRYAKTPKDMYWRKADDLLKFHEIRGTCLGYSESSTDGNAIGPILRKQILQTIKDLLVTGEVDPVIFELLHVFQEGMGCDRVSDLLTFVLYKEIKNYTQRIIDKCDLPCSIQNDGRKKCINVYNHRELLLLPKVILNPLPIVQSFSNIEYACGENQRVRNEINKYIQLGKRKILKKNEIHELMEYSLPFREGMVYMYKTHTFAPYDFKNDPAGEYIWYKAAREYTDKYPLVFEKTQLSMPGESYRIIKLICKQFAELIENNGLNALLYDSNGKPKHESAAQLLYYGIADSYCKANDLDLIREGNNGRGPVDFKLSRGAADKALVEVKLTSNKQLIHGIKTQLPIYMRQENVKKSLYLIIDNGNETAINHFEKFYNGLIPEQKEKIEYLIIDAKYKKSASKA